MGETKPLVPLAAAVQWENVLGTGLILSPTQFSYERRQRCRVSTTIRAASNCRSTI